MCIRDRFPALSTESLSSNPVLSAELLETHFSPLGGFLFYYADNPTLASSCPNRGSPRSRSKAGSTLRRNMHHDLSASALLSSSNAPSLFPSPASITASE